MPACWVLLPDKRSVTYKKLWELIGFHVDCCPDTAIFDMEVASTSTFLDQFEGAMVRLCSGSSFLMIRFNFNVN